MKFNPFFKLNALLPPCNRYCVPVWAGLFTRPLRTGLLCVFFLVPTILGPRLTAADCIYPIALWKLEESGADPEYQNAVNPGHQTGTCRKIDETPVCPEAEEARYGNGQRFYVDSGIDIPSSDIFNWDNTDSFSISFWMKRNNAPRVDNEVIIGRDSLEVGNDLHWWIGVHKSGLARAVFLDRNDNREPPNRYLKADKVLTDNQWHYVVFTRNGATFENRLYVDGQLEDRTVVSYGSDAFIANTTPINIGWIKLDPRYQYKGMVDEIAVYDVALPQWFIHDRFHADERYTSTQTDPCD